MGGYNHPLKPKTLSNVLCACGCNQFTYLSRWSKKPRKYIKGHNNRGKNLSQKHINIIIKTHTGNKYRLGKRHSEETKQKMRRPHLSARGLSPWNKGKHYKGWSKGLTKETDSRVRKHAISMMGKPTMYGIWWDNTLRNYTSKFTDSLREKIRKKYNHICQGKDCGVPEIECDRKLDVHHIDYNKKNCKILNLIPLCKKCHTKTNFNRAYWRDYFINKLKEQRSSYGKRKTRKFN